MGGEGGGLLIPIGFDRSKKSRTEVFFSWRAMDWGGHLLINCVVCLLFSPSSASSSFSSLGVWGKGASFVIIGGDVFYEFFMYYLLFKPFSFEQKP